MKNIFLPIIFLTISFLSAGSIALRPDRYSGYNVKESSGSGFLIEFSVGELNFEDIKTERGYFAGLSFRNSGSTHEAGLPKLPVFRELIEIPLGSVPSYEIVSVKESEMLLSEQGILNKIIPAQPSYSKSSKPEERIFVYDENFYRSGAVVKIDAVKISKSGTMRGVDVGVIEINPIEYNPAENKISVKTEILVKVTFSGVKSDPSLSKANEYSPYFDGMFSKLINRTPIVTKNELTRYPVTYLIVANETLNGNAKLDEFVAWKTQKGFKVITEYFPSTATTSTIDTWVEAQYLNLSPKPTFLLIVGDQSGAYVIPTEQNPALGSQGSVSVSDLLYGVMGATGATNRIPSIHVGRMSVNNTTELDAQIDKTIWYEKTQFTSEADLTYLSSVMGVAGVDGSYGPTHGNPHIRYGMTYYFNDNYRIPLDGSGVNITGIPFYYPASANSSVDPAVVAQVSTGVAFYNYTAHGYNNSFSDPTFTITNVDNLTNTGKYPFVVGNCCLTGSFRDTECFGEAWLNAPNKGGIGFVGASMSTYWDEDLAMGVGKADSGTSDGTYLPPLSVDEPGMYDGLMKMTNPTQAGIKFVGLMAVERLGTSMTSSYWSSYHLFGDPSLMVYMGIPLDNVVSHSPFLTPGETFFTVQAKKGSYVAITDDDGVLHGAAIADQFGYAVVPIEPFTTGNANIVVTCQFKKPYFVTIPVEAITGPYLLNNFADYSTNVFGGSGTVDMELKNIGIQTAQGITVAASSLSSYITFTDFNESYSNIAAGDSLRKNSVFAYNISPNAPDEEEIRIDLTINDTSKRTYSSALVFNVSSPVISFSESFEGDVYPGQSKDITFTLENTGSAALSNVTATLVQLSEEQVTISAPQNIISIAAGGSSNIIFTLGFGDLIKNGTAVDLRLDLSTTGGYANSYEFTVNVGMTENFETADFSSNDWNFEGEDSKWVIDNTVYYSGSYSARSGIIANGQFTTMKIDFEFLEDGSINFYRKTSSESNYDKLTFYIDGVSKGYWSGLSEWIYQTYPVSAGTRTLAWTYSKDASDAVGLDCAWIDNILATNILLSIEEDPALIPDTPVLHQNYPNPFNPTTTIRFSVPSVQNVKLSIFNSNGQLVKTMLDRKMEKGSYAVVMDASDLISGIYFYSLETQGSKFTHKMLLLK